MTISTPATPPIEPGAVAAPRRAQPLWPLVVGVFGLVFAAVHIVNACFVGLTMPMVYIDQAFSGVPLEPVERMLLWWLGALLVCMLILGVMQLIASVQLLYRLPVARLTLLTWAIAQIIVTVIALWVFYYLAHEHMEYVLGFDQDSLVQPWQQGELRMYRFMIVITMLAGAAWGGVFPAVVLWWTAGVERRAEMARWGAPAHAPAPATPADRGSDAL